MGESSTGGEPAAEDIYTTPQKMKATFKRRNRDSVLSPGSLRLGKTSRIHDEAMMEKVQMMIKSEINFMRDDLRKEMHASAESYRNSMYVNMKRELGKELLGIQDEKCSSLKTELQNLIKAEVNVMECIVQKRLEDEVVAKFESWKTNMEKCMREKDAIIEELKGELATFKLASNKEEDTQPSMLKELEEVKEQMKTLREGEEQKSKATSSWAERLFKTQEKVDEAEKWIEDAKRGKTQMPVSTPTSTIINMTIEEEQKRKTRALHVRITGIKDEGNVEEETKELLQRMGISEPMHTSAWRVGKKGVDEKGNVKDRALILRFPTLEIRKEFLKKEAST